MSVDLIYGTPGESPADWQRSLDAALSMRPDHVSAYALIVEDGTRLAAWCGGASWRRPTTTTSPTST